MTQQLEAPSLAARPAALHLSGTLFLERLRREAKRHYHDRHPFHVRMLDGTLSSGEIRLWVLNRFYYQTRIPIKDALILAKSEDPAFRRSWLRRIVDHDGGSAGEGGIALWQRLAEAVGIGAAELHAPSAILPGVRFACDAYVGLVRESSLVEAVAMSLTEVLAPDLMERRLLAFERHYPWIDSSALQYFKLRIPRARQDADEALLYVREHATTRSIEDACVQALVSKAQILWQVLDSIEAAGRASARPG